MRRMREAAALALAVAAISSSVVVAPQYWGATEAVRGPVLTAVDDAGLTDVVWRMDGDKPPDYVADCDLDAFTHELAANGFTRNPLANKVFVGDDPAEGSWAYRDHPLATYQTHVTVNEIDDGVAVYVHREWNHLRHPVRHHENPGGPDTAPDGPEKFRRVLGGEADGFAPSLAADVDCSISAVGS